MTARLLLGISLVGTVAAGGLAFRVREGRSSFPGHVDPDLLGGSQGRPWTVLAFTSPLCRACQDTPGIVAEALEVDVDELDEAESPVAFEPVDVTERGDLVEALDVTSTPTVAVVDHEGRVRFAREGNPTPDELARVLTPPVGA